MDPSSPAPESINLSTDDSSAPIPALITARTRGFILLAVALMAILALIKVHANLAAVGDEYSGALAIVDRVFDLLLVAGLAFVAFCVGNAISGALSISFWGAAEELAFSVMLGTGALGLATLGLGLSGLLSPLPVSLLLIGLIGITGRRGIRRTAALLKATSQLRSSRRSRIVAVLFGLVVGVLALRSLLPPTAFDELIYHLPIAKSFVEHGRVFPVYDIPHGNFPSLIHMIYVLCIMAKSDIAARLFSLSLGVATAIAIYAFCARFLERKIGVIAMFGFFGAGMVIEVAITARVDVTLAGMLFAATYALMVYLDTRQPGWLYASAILAGLSLGIKYHAGIWLVLVGLIYLFEAISSRRLPLRKVLQHGFLYVAIAVGVASPWYIKNLIWFHNPIYWVTTGEVRDTPPLPIRYFTDDDERKMDGHLDEARREIPRAVELQKQEMESWASYRFERHPLRVWDQFLHPGIYNMGEPYHDPNYLFLIAPVFLLLQKRKWLVWLGLCCTAFFILVANISWVGRHLLPVYPGMTIISAFVLQEVSRKLRPYSSMASILPAIAVGVAVGSGLIVSSTAIYRSNGIGFLKGSTSRREFMLQFGYYPPIDLINHRLPSDARIMMLGAQLGYGLKRDYVADPGWDATEWRRLLVHNNTFEEISQDIKRQGITHILLYPHLFRMIAAMGAEGTGPNAWISHGSRSPGAQSGAAAEQEAADRPDYWNQFRTWATFELYRAKYLDEIYADRYEFHLYRVK